VPNPPSKKRKAEDDSNQEKAKKKLKVIPEESQESMDDQSKSEEAKTTTKPATPSKRKAKKPAKGTPPSKKQKSDLKIVITACHENSKTIIKRATQELGAEIVDEVTPETYVVCEANNRTESILRALAQGSWIVTLPWIRNSLKNKKWLDPIGYEATRFHCGARSSREAKESNKPRLFENIKFYLSEHTELSHNSVAEILKFAGGLVVDELTADVGYYVTADDETFEAKPEHGQVIKETWIYDCLSQYSLRDCHDYLLRPSAFGPKAKKERKKKPVKKK